MATFEKEFVQSYGSLEKFAKEDGCYKIYESDGNYHAVRKPADEQGILTSPYVKNPRLVWEKNIGTVAGEALEKIEKAIEPKDLHLPPAIEFTGAPAGPLEHVPEKDSNLPPKKRKQVLAVIINLLVIIAFASLITAIVGVFSRNWILAGTMFGISIVSFVPFFFPSTQRLVKEGTEKRNKKKIIRGHAPAPRKPQPTERSLEAKSFLGGLSSEDRARVSNFNPILYHSIIKEKKGEQAPAIVMEDEAGLILLRRLRVDELEQLLASVEAGREGDRATTSNVSRAAGFYKKAADINPYNDLALMSYGCALANQGNLREGVKWVEKAVRVNPSNERAKRNLQGMKRNL